MYFFVVVLALGVFLLLALSIKVDKPKSDLQEPNPSPEPAPEPAPAPEVELVVPPVEEGEILQQPSNSRVVGYSEVYIESIYREFLRSSDSNCS